MKLSWNMSENGVAEIFSQEFLLAQVRRKNDSESQRKIQIYFADLFCAVAEMEDYLSEQIAWANSDIADNDGDKNSYGAGFDRGVLSGLKQIREFLDERTNA